MAKSQTQSSNLPALMAVAELNKAIDALVKSMRGIQDKVQQIGVQALMHHAKHGDVGPLNRLYVGMPKGMRRQALGSWLLAHGAVSVNMDTGTRGEKPFNHDKAKKTDPEAALADPWQDHLPEKDIAEVFDLQKAIHGLLQRAKGKTIQLHGQTVDASHAIDSLKALAAIAGEEYVPEVKNAAADKVISGKGKHGKAVEPTPASVG